ncbi:MAG: hypothetical protein U1F23_02460 [Lysobacterales bacterium]
MKAPTTASFASKIIVGTLPLLILGACTSAALRYYPRPDVRSDSHAPTSEQSIVVLLGQDVPNCEYQELGTLTYDWARDGIPTTENTVIDAFRGYAAQLGATGIYKVQLTNGGVVGLGSVAATGSGGVGFFSAGHEVGGTAVAYVCSRSVDHEQQGGREAERGIRSPCGILTPRRNRALSPAAPAAPPTHAAAAVHGSCESGLSVRSKADDGSIVILDDGSVWQVSSVDTVDARLWLPAEQIVACDDKLINTDDNSTVEAQRIK